MGPRTVFTVGKLSRVPEFVGQLGKLRPIVNRSFLKSGGNQPPRRLPACPTSQFFVHDSGIFEGWRQGAAGEAGDYAGYDVVQRSIQRFGVACGYCVEG
jgi:hypothetical protein